MRAATVTAAAVLLFGVAWFGRAVWGGHFLVDHSPGMDVYHLSTLYERWAHHLWGGHFPSWFPEFAGGFPAPAAWMYGLYYPGNLLFAVLPADAAWTWTALLHMTLAAVGMHRLVRAETGDRVAAVTAGVLFGASDFMIGRALCGHLNLVAPLAWAPWVLLHLRGAAEGRRSAVGWGVVCLSLGVLSGHVQAWFYLAPAMVAYAVVLARGRPDRRGYLRRVLTVAGLVTALTAVQWLAALELSSLSERAAASSADPGDFSAPLHVLVAKVFPGVLGHRPDTYWAPELNDHEFVGIGGLLLVTLALPALLRRRRLDWFWAALAATGLLLAPGVRNGLSDLLNRIPPLGWSRAPARALLLTCLGGAVLAGRGIAEWRRLVGGDPARVRRTIRVTAVVVGVLAVAGIGGLVVLLGEHGIGDQGGTVARAVVTSLLLAGSALTVIAVSRGRPRSWIALPSLALAAAVLGGVPPATTTSADFYYTDWASLLPSDLSTHRVHLLSGRFPNVERQGLRTLREICYADTRWYHEFLDGAGPARAAWLDVQAELADVPRERLFGGSLGPDDVVGKPYPGLGNGRVFDGARVEASSQVVLAALDRGDQVLVLADRPDPDRPSGNVSRPVPGAQVSRLAGEDPSTVRYDVETPVEGWLFVAEKYYPGWEADVNGRPTPVRRANVMFRAVEVPAGRSRVTFSYRPWTGRWGAVAGLLGLLGTAFVFVRGRRRRSLDPSVTGSGEACRSG